MTLVLHNSMLILPDRTQRGGVIVRNGRVAEVFVEDRAPTGLSRGESIDLEGAYLAPGLIDIHIHGSAGVDVQATDAAGLAELAAYLLAEGVTGFFATFVPADERGYRDAIAAIDSYNAREDEAYRNNKPQVAARILPAQCKLGSNAQSDGQQQDSDPAAGGSRMFRVARSHLHPRSSAKRCRRWRDRGSPGFGLDSGGPAVVGPQGPLDR